LRDDAAEREMTWLMATVTSARSVRAANEIAPKVKLPFSIEVDQEQKAVVLERERALIEAVANVSIAALRVVSLPTQESAKTSSPSPVVQPDDSAEGPVAKNVAEGITVIVPLSGLVDLNKEKDRLTRVLAKVEKDLATLGKKLSNADFMARAPAEVVTKDKERTTELEAARSTLAAALAKLG
jgi:valyl-tRNA synthetase